MKMKYDLSKIMKRAWDIKKKANNTFAQALKMSWKIAKFEVSLLVKYGKEETGKVVFNLWVNYGKVRTYYKCSWFSNYENTHSKVNYIDLV
jgi:hypothetical protein